MTECRCVFCKHYLFSYEFKGEFHITVKCRSCLKVNVFSFARVCVTMTPMAVITV